MKNLNEYININSINETKKYVLLDTTADNYDELDWDYFIEDIEEVDKDHELYLISGNLGLWDGKKEIYPEVEKYLRKAFERCTKNVDDVIVELKNGKLEVTGIHHDGRNVLYISALSEKGIDLWEQYDNGDIENLDFLKNKDTFEEIKI